jgi:hypothetical protein
MSVFPVEFSDSTTVDQFLTSAKAKPLRLKMKRQWFKDNEVSDSESDSDEDG